MKVRLANFEEAEIVYDLIRKLNAHHIGMEMFFYLTLDNLREDMKANLFHVGLLYKNPFKEAIGFILFTDTYSMERGRGVYLEEYYVEPHLRGYGLGSYLMSWLCQWALHQACRHVRVIYQSGIKLEKFYEHMGFENDMERRGVKYFEICHCDEIDKMLENVQQHSKETTTMPTDQDQCSIQVDKINETSCQVTIKNHMETCQFIQQQSYGSWMGRCLAIGDITGNEELLTIDRLSKCIVDFRNSCSRPLWAIWIEYIGENQKFLQTLETMEFVNIGEEEGWNIVYLPQKAVERHAAKLSDFEDSDDEDEDSSSSSSSDEDSDDDDSAIVRSKKC